MKTISKQIEERQALLVALQDELAAKAAELDNAEDAEPITARHRSAQWPDRGATEVARRAPRAESSLAQQSQHIIVRDDGDDQQGDDSQAVGRPQKDHSVRSPRPHAVVTALSRARRRRLTKCSKSGMAKTGSLKAHSMS
jgi:hypothetical protein